MVITPAHGALTNRAARSPIAKVLLVPSVMSVNRVRLLARLHDEDVDFDELQNIIGRDVALSYNLLRFINSAFFSLPRRVDSIRDALVLLGTQNVLKWATLMALGSSAPSTSNSYATTRRLGS